MKIVEKVWGSEQWYVNTDKYCLKHLYLKSGYRCSTHHHKIKDETFVLISGHALLCLKNTSFNPFLMEHNIAYHVAPETWHYFAGLSDAVIVEVSTHHDDKDSYRLNSSGVCDFSLEIPLNKNDRLLQDIQPRAVFTILHTTSDVAYYRFIGSAKAILKRRRVAEVAYGPDKTLLLNTLPVIPID